MDDSTDHLFEVSYFTQTCLKFKDEKEVVALVASSRRVDSMTLCQVIRTLPNLSSYYNGFSRCQDEKPRH